MQVDNCTYENTYTSALEVFEFRTNPLERVFCYPTKRDNVEIASTWMGDALSLSPIRYGRTWKDNFGGERRSLSFHALNGHWYHGTLFNGSYIRAKRGKLA